MTNRLIAMSIALLIASCVSAWAQDRLRVGYRKEAAPFVYQEDGERVGFLYDLCKHILDKTGLPYEWTLVEADSRLPALGAGKDGLQIDLLCDPLTVTLKRSETILFSPVLFVSGGSYLEVEFREGSASQMAYARGRSAWEELGEAVSHDGTTVPFSEQPAKGTKQVSVKSCSVLQKGQIGSIRIGIIKDSTGPEIIASALLSENPSAVNPSPWETVCYEEFNSHSDGLANLCKGSKEDEYPLSYYFGDRDIILTYLERQLESQGGCPDVVASDRFYSIEPYALGVSERVSREQYILLQNALFEAFSETYEESGTSLPFFLFQKYFRSSRPSSSLSAVFTSLMVPR